MRAFTNQYRWSGSGVDTGPVVTSHGHSLSGPSRRALGWRSYVVTLDPALKKGQHATIAVRQQLTDDVEAFDPYLAKTVHETMDRLTLRVRLPTTSSASWCGRWPATASGRRARRSSGARPR